MLLTMDQFVQRLTQSGLLTAEELAAIQEQIPARPEHAKELAEELIQRKKLTPFQAEAILKGSSPPLVLGNYLLLDLIGEGGMGRVFRAVHRRMGRVVALKTLSAALSKSIPAMQRFHREVQAAARLAHPNIVIAYDADEAEGIHFLVMEYVEGTDLWALVRKHGPLAPERAMNHVLQAARGLAYAHAQGIIHRDIKPSNLLVDSAGTVKILDLGLARLRATDDGKLPNPTELTPAGAVMGTVDFLAPEQALNAKTADHRADIYSLGCTLYFLLTGRAMYNGESIMEKLLAHREQPIPALGPSVPPHVDAIFRKMVAKRPEERYPSMSAVLAALQSWPGPTSLPAEMLPPYVRPLTEGPAGPSSRPAPKPRKLLIAGSAATIFAILIVSGAVWMTGGWSGNSASTAVHAPSPNENLGPVSTNRKPSPSPISAGNQTERRAAEWGLKLGGTVDVSVGSADARKLKPGSVLPEKPFVVTSIELPNVQTADIDSGLSCLEGLQSLYYLDLKNTKVTGKGLRHIRGLTSLSSLELADTPVTDSALESLQGLVQLKLLDLKGTAVTDAGLEWLGRLHGLSSLRLQGTKVTDKGLETVKKLKGLRRLNLQDTSVTAAGVKDLKGFMPKCQVEH